MARHRGLNCRLDGRTPFEIFLDNVLGDNTHPLVTAREAAYRSAVMEALYQGSNEKRWVSVGVRS